MSGDTLSYVGDRRLLDDPAVVEAPELAPVRGYIGDEGGDAADLRRFQLAGQLAGLFTEYAVAVSTRNEDLRRILEKRFFRDEFKPAFNAWIKMNPLRNEDAPDVPFGMKQYKLADLEESEQIGRAHV